VNETFDALHEKGKYWPEHSPFGFPVSTVWKPPDNGINNGRTVIDIPQSE
jgi:hypothetical protein